MVRGQWKLLLVTVDTVMLSHRYSLRTRINDMVGRLTLRPHRGPSKQTVKTPTWNDEPKKNDMLWSKQTVNTPTWNDAPKRHIALLQSLRHATSTRDRHHRQTPIVRQDTFARAIITFLTQITDNRPVTARLRARGAQTRRAIERQMGGENPAVAVQAGTAQPGRSKSAKGGISATMPSFMRT